MSAYRIAAEMPKEPKVKTKEDVDIARAKATAWVIGAAIFVLVAAIAGTSNYSTYTTLKIAQVNADVELKKAEAAKETARANEAKAMFESMVKK